MQRTFKFLGELTEDGLLHHDRDEVRVTLLDLEAAIFQLGGVMTMSAVRTELAPGQFETTGVLIAYDSFSPAQRVEEHEDAHSA
jgi:hypothetical protein